MRTPSATAANAARHRAWPDPSVCGAAAVMIRNLPLCRAPTTAASIDSGAPRAVIVRTAWLSPLGLVHGTASDVGETGGFCRHPPGRGANHRCPPVIQKRERELSAPARTAGTGPRDAACTSAAPTFSTAIGTAPQSVIPLRCGPRTGRAARCVAAAVAEPTDLLGSKRQSRLLGDRTDGGVADTMKRARGVLLEPAHGLVAVGGDRRQLQARQQPLAAISSCRRP